MEMPLALQGHNSAFLLPAPQTSTEITSDLQENESNKKLKKEQDLC